MNLRFLAGCLSGLLCLTACHVTDAHDVRLPLAKLDFEESYELPVVSLQELQRPLTGTTRERLSQAVRDAGMLVVRHIPGYPPARRAILRKVAACAEVKSKASAVFESTMADGTSRQTFATSSTAGRPQPLTLPAACLAPGEEDPSLTLRELVDEVARAFSNRLDDLVARATASDPSKTNDTCDPSFADFSKVAAASQQKELFHVYVAQDNVTGESEGLASYASLQDAAAAGTLPLHTDSGVFHVVTPSLYLELPGLAPRQHGDADGGLALQLRSGQVVRPAVPEDGLVVMLGEAASSWLAPPCVQLHIPAHTMVLPEGRVARSWYGRMYLPLEVLVDVQSTEKVGAAIRGEQMGNGTLKADEVTSKMPMPMPMPGSPPSSSYCNKAMGMDMFMGGFMTARDSSASSPCLMIFFKEWKLTSKQKLAGACIGTVNLGMLVELLVYVRRRMRASRLAIVRPRAARLATIALFAVQVSLGYFLMLIAMSYQVELFCMVVLGLVLGHAIFNGAAPIVEQCDPCCVDEDAADHLEAPLLVESGSRYGI
eukprot:gene6192-7423_t